MPKKAFDKQIAGWDFFSRSLEDQTLPPEAEEQHRILERAVEEAYALHAERLQLRAQAMAASRRLRAVIARGQEAESRLRAYLKLLYGGTSQLLGRHGIKPRRRGRRVEEEPPRFGPAPSEEGAAPEEPEGPEASPVPHDRARVC